MKSAGLNVSAVGSLGLGLNWAQLGVPGMNITVSKNEGPLYATLKLGVSARFRISTAKCSHRLDPALQ